MSIGKHYKNLILSGLLIFLSISTLMAYNSTSNSKSFKDLNKASKYKKYSENYLKKAKYYEQKAQKTKSDASASVYYSLSEKYKQMADQKLNMSEAFQIGDKELYKQSSLKYSELSTELKQISTKKNSYKKNYTKSNNEKYLIEKGTKDDKNAQINELKEQLVEIQKRISSIESQNNK